jgi:hypothetical protein
MKIEVPNKHNPKLTDMWPISVSLFQAQKLPLNISICTWNIFALISYYVSLSLVFDEGSGLAGFVF